MLKLICVSFSVLVFSLAAVAGAQSHPATSGAVMASASSCQAARLQCKAECADLNGGALGACLRACDVEYKQCLSGQSSIDTESSADCESLAAGVTSEPFGPQPEALVPLTCVEKLELCGESCDGDISCNRACVRAYRKCLGH